MTLCRNLIIQLTDRATAEITRIFVLPVCLANLLVNFFKFRVGDDRLPAQDQLTLIRNMQRNILEYARVVRNDFSDLSISARDCFFQRTVAICQHNGQSVQLPRHQYFMASCKFCQCRYILCLIQREHRFLMSLLRELFQRLIANCHRRASGQHNPGLLFQCSQFIV